MQCRYRTCRLSSIVQQDTDDADLLRAIALSLQPVAASPVPAVSPTVTVAGVSEEEAAMSRVLEESFRDTTCWEC